MSAFASNKPSLTPTATAAAAAAVRIILLAAVVGLSGCVANADRDVDRTMAPPTCIRWDRIDIGRASFPVTIDRDPVTGLERIRLGWVADEALVRRATDLLRFLDARQAELYWANPRDPASTARAQNDQRRENILNLMSRLAAQLSATTSSAKYAEILDAAEVEAATRFSYARAAPPAHGPMLAPDSERP